MSLKETARYAALGAAAALLVSGGIYAGSAFQAQQTSARASDGYSGNFDYVQKQATGGPAQTDDPTDAPEPAPAEDTQDRATGDSVPGTASNPAGTVASSESPAAAGDQPSPAEAAPTPAPAPSADASEDEPAPAQDPGTEVDEPAAEPEPGEAPAAEEPATEPEPGSGEDPAEPGGGSLTPGPAIFKAINPCLLVKCDPPPPPGKLTLDPCLVNQCAVAEDEPVFIPPIDYSKLPSLQLDLSK